MAKGGIEMTAIKAAELGKKVLDDYNAAMEAKDMKEKAYYADMEFKHGGQEKAYYEKMAAQDTRTQQLGASVPYKHVQYPKPWVGLTDEELRQCIGIGTEDSDWNVAVVQEWLRKVEAKLKEKNGA